MLKILQARLQQYVPRTHRCSSWILKRQRKQRSNCQYPLDHRKSNRILKNLLLLWLHQSLWLCSVQFSRSVVSDSLRPHEQQHTRPSCLSPTAIAYPNPCPLSHPLPYVKASLGILKTSAALSLLLIWKYDYSTWSTECEYQNLRYIILPTC